MGMAGSPCRRDTPSFNVGRAPTKLYPRALRPSTTTQLADPTEDGRPVSLSPVPDPTWRFPNLPGGSAQGDIVPNHHRIGDGKLGGVCVSPALGWDGAAHGTHLCRCHAGAVRERESGRPVWALASPGRPIFGRAVLLHGRAPGYTYISCEMKTGSYT